MSKVVWKVYVDYGSGYGWIPVSWSPTFDSEQEANDWINDPEKEWESYAKAMSVEVEDEEDEPDLATNDYKFVLEGVSIWVDLVSDNPDEFRASIYDTDKELLQEAWGNTIAEAISKAITYITEEN
jgi:hypothetical protein